jgi:hypothetical protein
MIATREQSASASSIECVVRKMVVPDSDRRFSMCSQTALRATGSRPTVGSSRKRTLGRWSVDWAISSRRIMPPEYSRTSLSAASASPMNASAARMRSARSRRGMS